MCTNGIIRYYSGKVFRNSQRLVNASRNSREAFFSDFFFLSNSKIYSRTGLEYEYTAVPKDMHQVEVQFSDCLRLPSFDPEQIR